MTYRYTTPAILRAELEGVLRRAGFAHPVCSKVRYGTADDDRPVLKTSVFEYSSVRMPLEALEGYERVLSGLPGVIATHIVHEDKGTLRDQVQVTHLRMRDEPEETGR